MKNILLILCDQLRKDTLGCYGNPICRTPHIDALAARGGRARAMRAARLLRIATWPIRSARPTA